MIRPLCLALLLAAPAGAADPPNVLFVAIDDLNHWVGHLGRHPQAKTPNIDKLAARGVAFRRAYCAAPVCNPSRAALMSGLRPGDTGVYDNGQNFRPAIAPEKTLTSQFRKAGYRVAGAGKIYHGSAHRPEEWDDYFEPKGGADKKLELHASAKNDGVGGIKFAPIAGTDQDLEDYAIVDYGIKELGRKHDKPFFLAVGLHKPHMPWFVPKKYYDLFPLDTIELPLFAADDLADVPAAGVRMAKPKGDHAAIEASGRWKEAVQGYLAAIAYCDAQVGRLIDALDASAHKDNTVVVLFGDHGWHLGEKSHWRKFALWEESTRAPLIWVAPGVTKAGGLCDRTVDHMDIYPTLCDLCGVPKPGHVRGASLRPLLADPKAAWDRPAITTFHKDNHAVRTERFRYIRYADGGEELYDHAADPLERKNLAADPKFADAKAELRRLLPKENADERPAKKDKE